MKLNFVTSIKSKKIFQALISNYNIIYSWIFKDIIKISVFVKKYAPTLIQSVKQYIGLNIKFSVVNIKSFNRFNSYSEFDINYKSIIRELNFINPNNITYVKIKSIILSLIENIGNLNKSKINIGLKSQLSIGIFNFLDVWDYKNPNDPIGSEQYLLSELDDKYLSDMDGEIN